MISKAKARALFIIIVAGAALVAAAVARVGHGEVPALKGQPAASSTPHAGEDGHYAEDGHDGEDEHGRHAEHPDADAGGHEDEVTLTPQAIARHQIETRPATRQVLTSAFTAPGRISFNTEAMAHVGSVLSGRIVEMKVRLGDSVSRGDELFVVESPELAEAQGDFLQKRASVSVASAAVDPARLAYERARQLHEKNEGIALAEVEKRQAEWRAAQGALETAEAALASARNRLHVMGLDAKAIEDLATTGKISPRSAIHAPLSGRVVEREVTLGELVHPDRDALLVLANMEKLWVIADVPEARLADVRIGSRARVEVSALGAKAFEGKVVYVAPALNADTRTASVRVEVAGGDGALRPGMFARVELSAAAAAGNRALLVVPEEAVHTVEGESSIFVAVAGETGTFARRAVETGTPVGGQIPILSGLAEGESVVTRGAFVLKADLGKSGASHEH